MRIGSIDGLFLDKGQNRTGHGKIYTCDAIDRNILPGMPVYDRRVAKFDTDKM